MRTSTDRSALRHVLTVTLPAVVGFAGALLGHPSGGPIAPDGAAGMARMRCSRACGGRCRSAIGARALVL